MFVSLCVVKVDDDPDAMIGHRPLDDGPLREGFRWRQQVIHNRKECSTEWVVTELESGRMLAQTMRHFCATTTSIQRRLAVVQFEAERVTGPGPWVS